MDKFIFVCYEHGTGGESLAVEISKLSQCEYLDHEKQGKRTWTKDFFNKLFLREYNPGWMSMARHHTGSKYKVIPSHYRPEKISQMYPQSLYVVINAPKTAKERTSLMKRIYKNVWLTGHKSLDQKIGYFEQHAGKLPDRHQLKLLSKTVNNGQIQCLINNKALTTQNTKEIFREWAKGHVPNFSYSASDNLTTLEYQSLIENKTGNLFDWLVDKIEK